MRTLGQLAEYGNRTVISTIHQPNSDIFEQFDRLLLLARGKIIYFNKANQSVEYFGSNGNQCPELSNPCDFFMSMMSKESIEFDCDDGEIDNDKIEQEYETLITKFHNDYQRSDLKCNADEVHPNIVAIDGGRGAISQTPWCYQFNLLAKRNFLNLIRLPQTSYVKLITTCVTAGFAALLFWQAGALIDPATEKVTRVTYN